MKHKLAYGFIFITILVILSQPLSRPYDLLTDLLILFLLLVCACVFLVQLALCIRERFKDRQRLGLLALIPIAFSLFPLMLWGFPKEVMRDNSILKAGREGAANCMTYFELKDDNKFEETVICFGTHVTKGNYHLKGDTILLTNVTSDDRGDEPYYKFGLIKNGIQIPSLPTDTAKMDTTKYLHLYHSHSDSTPLWLYVSYNAALK